MKVEACIFDLDGVVVDTAKYHFAAWRKIAGELGFEFTERQNEMLKGISRLRSLEILLEIGGIALNEHDKELLTDKKNNIYLEYILHLTPDDVLPGVSRFLSELHTLGIRTAIGSASRNAGTILDKLQIRNLFDVLVDGWQVEKAKPDPEIFRRCAEALKVLPINCVVFEDAEAGIEAALAAGMKCVGVGNIRTLAKADIVISGFENFSFQKLRMPRDRSLGNPQDF